MEFIETAVFTQRIKEILREDEYRALQFFLIQRPGSGDVIPGGQGLRKLRWKTQDKGRSGGARIIYYWMNSEDQIYFIYAFKKNEQADLTKDQLKALAEYVKRGVL